VRFRGILLESSSLGGNSGRKEQNRGKGRPSEGAKSGRRKTGIGKAAQAKIVARGCAAGIAGVFSTLLVAEANPPDRCASLVGMARHPGDFFEQTGIGWPRRRFLRLARGLLTGFCLGRLADSGSSLAPDLPTFEEIPSSESGITWVHSAGKSAEKY